MQGMREILRGSLAKSLGSVTPLDKLATAWVVVCGKAMAERSEILSYEGGVVRAGVCDEGWMRHMVGMRGRLAVELAKIAGLTISEIHFELMPR